MVRSLNLSIPIRIHRLNNLLPIRLSKDKEALFKLVLESLKTTWKKKSELISG